MEVVGSRCIYNLRKTQPLNGDIRHAVIFAGTELHIYKANPLTHLCTILQFKNKTETKYIKYQKTMPT